jgi:hypothetical protein
VPYLNWETFHFLFNFLNIGLKVKCSNPGNDNKLKNANRLCVGKMPIGKHQNVVMSTPVDIKRQMVVEINGKQKRDLQDDSALLGFKCMVASLYQDENKGYPNASNTPHIRASL